MTTTRIHPRLMVVLPGRAEHGRQVLSGVARYIERAQRAWRVLTLEPHEPQAMAVLLAQGIDGVLLYRNVILPQPLDCPVVAYGGVVDEQLVHANGHIAFDHAAAGRMAGEFLINQGLRRLGYVGEPWARRMNASRLGGLRESALAYGIEVDVLELPSAGDVRHEVDHIQTVQDWLARQSHPLGVLCFNDAWAALVIDAATQLGLRVPNEVAVMGIGDDEVRCHLCRPPLSSVNTNGEQMGYEAAKMLDQLINGHALPKKSRMIPVRGIEGRQSTDVLTFGDTMLGQAIRFIRDNAEEAITADQAAEAAGMSVRAMQVAFRKHIGHSFSDELWRIRTERAMVLLRDTRWPLIQVAVHSGMSSASHLCRVIKQRTGMTPGQFRVNGG